MAKLNQETETIMLRRFGKESIITLATISVKHRMFAASMPFSGIQRNA